MRSVAFYPFGASCNVNQTQGTMPNVFDASRLSRGFAVATTSLNVLGHHCNPVISAETAMMAKNVEIHTPYHAYALEERLEANNGHALN
ncbi:MAG: DUF6351 family protein, partial [Candidatus Binatia bacterium]